MNGFKFNHYPFTDEQGRKCVAVVTLDDNGAAVRCVSTCDAEDDYDEQFGKDLGEKKCIVKVQERRLREELTLANWYEEEMQYYAKLADMYNAKAKKTSETLAKSIAELSAISSGKINPETF